MEELACRAINGTVIYTTAMDKKAAANSVATQAAAPPQTSRFAEPEPSSVEKTTGTPITIANDRATKAAIKS